MFCIPQEMVCQGILHNAIMNIHEYVDIITVSVNGAPWISKICYFYNIKRFIVKCCGYMLQFV